MPKTKELEPVAMMVNGMAHGYRPAPSTRRVSTDPAHYPKAIELVQNVLAQLPPGTDGYFEAELRADLTFEQIERLDLNKPWPEVFAQIAPYVVAWNADAFNDDTGEWERLPPPAEAGPEVFRRLQTAVALFLWMCLKWSLGGDLPKERRRSGDTDAT